MTPEEVRIRLGFRPWPEFASEIASQNPDTPAERWRRTGRTTQSLVRAVSELTEGRDVLILAWSRDASDRHLRTLHEYWFRVSVNIDSRRTQILALGRDAEVSLAGFDGWLVIDHYIEEMFPNRVRSLRSLWRPPTEKSPPPAIYRPTSFELLLAEDPF